MKALWILLLVLFCASASGCCMFMDNTVAAEDGTAASQPAESSGGW